MKSVATDKQCAVNHVTLFDTAETCLTSDGLLHRVLGRPFKDPVFDDGTDDHAAPHALPDRVEYLYFGAVSPRRSGQRRTRASPAAGYRSIQRVSVKFPNAKLTTPN